jgi:hypothetical protein
MPDNPDQAIPEWASALDDLLGRYWALEKLAPGRDPEKTGVPPMQFFRSLVYKLTRQFAKNNCARYGVEVAPENYAVCAPPAPPEIEAAALHVILDWLKPAPGYPPFTTHDEQQEVHELRRCLTRVVLGRLRHLEGEADNKPDKPKEKLFAIPENHEVIELAKRIKKGQAQGRSKIDIARGFTENDEKKAQSLLRQLRRHRWLLQ